MAKAKSKTVYVCSECGYEQSTQLGRCPECKAWGSMNEEVRSEEPAPVKKGRSGGGNWAGSRSGSVSKLSAINETDAPVRRDTHSSELNRVLGGGLVTGSVVLLGGDPGIGKSTLLLQTLAHMGKAGHKVLYVTGEESLHQVAQRAVRLELPAEVVDAVTETNTETIIATAEAEQPVIMVVDSIQTLESEALNSAAGTVSQVRESAALLTKYAKSSGCSVFLVGHVTKTGEIAGPRVLEHMVDAVLYFEGDPSSPYRLIRAMKNRFGPVNELGAFEMTETGLISVDNPSAMFLSDDRRQAAGSSVFVMQEGQRSLLIEIQALMDESSGPSPRRVATGVDNNRLAMLLGVLSKHLHMQVGGLDVFVNAVGGIKASEPAADLAICLAMLSSLMERPWATDIACFGEIGLTGELRPVQNAEDRVREAAKLGFKKILLPKRNFPRQPPKGIQILSASTLEEALAQVAGT